MNKAFRLLAICVIFSLLVAFPVKTEARPLALTLSQVSPSSCPAGGCAAGQRINAQATFNVTPVYTGGPNTLVCVYTSLEGLNKWADAAVFSIANTGTYTAGDQANTCSTIANIPSGTELLGEAYAQFSSTGSQNFQFGFRINKTSTAAGFLHLSIYEVDNAGSIWSLTDSFVSPDFPTAPAADPAYVAADVATCASNSPCYLNSGDDLSNGIGTGLKDAVDARSTASTINILGTYAIKSNSVTIDVVHIIQGLSNATLTYNNSTACSNAMLLVTAGATIRFLSINDGSCGSPSRDLILINSPADVTVRHNDLVNGKDAISILDNSGSVLIRFNHIVSNSGYGILRASGSGSGTVKAVVNNIYNNRVGSQAECNNKGEVNHNFWGPGVNPTSAISRCTYTAGKRLGAAVLNDGTPGVSAQTVTLTGGKDPISSWPISLEGTAGTKFIIANHGNGGLSNIPFLGVGTDNITACSDFFDVFVSDENTTTPLALNVYIQYNSSCVSIIETPSIYCGSPYSEDFPLLWYDPQFSVTDKWDTTGQTPAGSGASGMSGQTTTCDTTTDEIRVTIDSNSTERPNLVSDLNFTPFVIGYSNPDIVFSTFTAVPGIARADLHWETTREAGLHGYYVARSLSPYGPYNRDSYLIPAKGNADIGGIYNYSDLELNNGTTYWYMLEMIDASHTSIGFQGPVSASTFSMIPTATEITPSSAEVYGPSISVDISGNNFIPSSQAVWDNNLSIDLTSSYIDSTHLTAIIPSSLYNDPHSSAVHNITVYNPGSGGGFSPPLTFTIKNPVPTLTSITPEYSDGNVTTITLAVKGDYFVYDSDVRFNGSSANVTTTFVDRNNLTASILRSKLGSGTITVTVFNPSYGGGTSAGKSFNLYTPTPTLTKYPTSTKTTVSSYKSSTPQRTRTRTPTRTITGTIIITPSVTPGQLTPSVTIETTPGSITPESTTSGTSTPEPYTRTPTLAPGEPTYTPVPPTPEVEEPPSVWTWRFLSMLRVLAGSLAGIGLLSIPAFIVFRIKTKNKPTR
jgi:hypothetical protein